jgi:hypothetical protein
MCALIPPCNQHLLGHVDILYMAVSRGDWSTSQAVRITQETKPVYAFYRGLGGSQSRNELCGEEDCALLGNGISICH